ncbi:hypothetical protein QJS04_geneDACA022051 [Acorus gramineus]|uniref:Uncharacterized protein n=1 Tax=Acorus gramineus TaxID=55184 RepID=A0AAV9B511_ACOGR|nr:hypothetical protein QJS04_geneDACA022051 [Acorus gramineus]
MLASFDEVESSLDSFPLVRARMWRRKGARPPLLITVELGGWVVKIEVLKDELGRKPTFAEVVAGTSGSLGIPLGIAREAEHNMEGSLDPPPPTEDRYHHGGSSSGQRRRKPRRKRARRESRQTATEVPSKEEEELRGTRGKGTLHNNQGIAISAPGTQVAPRGVRMPGEGHPRPSPQKSEGSPLVVVTGVASRPASVPVAGVAFDKWQPYEAGGVEGMGLDCSEIHQDPIRGSCSGLPQSTLSIHNEFSPGSWANFIDSAGRICWQWNLDAGVGDSNTRRAILGSPSISSRFQPTVDDLDQPLYYTPPTGQLRSIVVGRMGHSQMSMAGSCSSYPSSQPDEELELECGLCSIVNQASNRVSPVRFAPSAHPEEVSSRLVVHSEVPSVGIIRIGEVDLPSACYEWCSPRGRFNAGFRGSQPYGPGTVGLEWAWTWYGKDPRSGRDLYHPVYVGSPSNPVLTRPVLEKFYPFVLGPAPEGWSVASSSKINQRRRLLRGLFILCVVLLASAVRSDCLRRLLSLSGQRVPQGPVTLHLSAPPKTWRRLPLSKAAEKENDVRWSTIAGYRVLSVSQNRRSGGHPNRTSSLINVGKGDELINKFRPPHLWCWETNGNYGVTHIIANGSENGKSLSKSPNKYYNAYQRRLDCTAEKGETHSENLSSATQLNEILNSQSSS